jgi:hypothetical protein
MFGALFRRTDAEVAVAQFLRVSLNVANSFFAVDRFQVLYFFQFIRTADGGMTYLAWVVRTMRYCSLVSG